MDDRPATPEEVDAVRSVIDGWAAGELRTNPLLRHVEWIADDQRWLVRLEGEDKAIITVWLTLRQRTLHHEAQFMPAPEANVAETLAYLMRSNANLYGMWFALGPEDAVYLVGKVPAALIDDDELDRIAGSSVLYVDDHFPTAMTLAYPTMYHRRPRRS